MTYAPRVTVLAAAALIAACSTEKSQNPLSPDVAGPLPGITISAPTPVQPANGQQLTQGNPVDLVLQNSTSNSPRPFWYQLELSGDAQFNQKLHTADRINPDPSGRTTYRIPAALGAGTYYWRARALDGANTGPYSGGAQFQVVPPVTIEIPVLHSPAANATTASNTVDLVVTNGAISGPTGQVSYRFEVANDQAFSSMVAVLTVYRSGGATTSTTLTELPYGRRFFWRVLATNGTITTPYTPVQSFVTPAAPPLPPTTPTPSPSPSPQPPGGGTVGGPRTISIEEALDIVENLHDSLGVDLGSNSTRESRVQFFFSAVAVIHYGHPRYNPRGPDSGWCVKDAGGGRPPSDDVIVRCSTREAYDLITGVGSNGYRFSISPLGTLPSEQNVYPPPRSALP